jgi:hypothetical protein
VRGIGVLGSPDSASCITPSRLGRSKASRHRKNRGSATTPRWTRRAGPSRTCSSSEPSPSPRTCSRLPGEARQRLGRPRAPLDAPETPSRCTGNHTRSCGQSFLPPMTGRHEPLIDRHARGPRSTRADGSRARPSVKNRRAWALESRSSLRARGAEACQGLLRYGAGWILGWRPKIVPTGCHRRGTLPGSHPQPTAGRRRGGR